MQRRWWSRGPLTDTGVVGYRANGVAPFVHETTPFWSVPIHPLWTSSAVVEPRLSPTGSPTTHPGISTHRPPPLFAPHGCGANPFCGIASTNSARHRSTSTGPQHACSPREARRGQPGLHLVGCSANSRYSSPSWAARAATTRTRPPSSWPLASHLRYRQSCRYRRFPASTAHRPGSPAAQSHWCGKWPSARWSATASLHSGKARRRQPRHHQRTRGSQIPVPPEQSGRSYGGSLADGGGQKFDGSR